MRFRLQVRTIALCAVCTVCAVFTGVLFTKEAWAIRPFVTDDARVVGKGHIQLETWWRRDRTSFQHWLLPAVGPASWLELTLGGVHGVTPFRSHPVQPAYSIGGPLFQAKVLLRETTPNEPPGVAIVVGGLTPAGRGSFAAPDWSGFTYLALTQAFIKEDDLLIHANIGVSTVPVDGHDPAKLTWGVGMQVETWFDFHLIGEIYSGDPYLQKSGGAYQLGFRQIYNDHLQLDFTIGGGLWGEVVMPPALSSGIRIVSHELF